MPPSGITSRFLWAQRALFGVICLTVVALLATVWSTYSSISHAGTLLTQGQAMALARAIRSEMFSVNDLPSGEILPAVFENLSTEGLRYLAVVDERGNVVQKAGESKFDNRTRIVIDSRWRVENPQIKDDTARFFQPLNGRGRRRSLDHDFVGRVMAVEFEPGMALQLRADGVRGLAMGGVAGIVLLVLAFVLVRWVGRQARVEKKIEQERHLSHLGTLSAVLAHQIRNPLASLKGNAQLLREMVQANNGCPDDAPNQSDERQQRTRKKVDRVVDEATRLENLVNDLLEFARTGGIDEQMASPTLLAQKVASKVSPDIQTDTSQAPAMWRFDSLKLEQALTNLCENAVRAGGPVSLVVSQNRQKLLLVVTDSGEGIPGEAMHSIFEPFFTTKTDGTGLGLSVAKRIVELHRGNLTARNRPQGGAEFTIELPG